MLRRIASFGLEDGIHFAMDKVGDNKMFRITKALENNATLLYRIEGRLTDEGLTDWNQEVIAMMETNDRQVILDFCGVWYMSIKAVDVLVNHIKNHVFILNCGMELRNVMHACGLSARMLE
jgi:hypothetical protein